MTSHEMGRIIGSTLRIRNYFRRRLNKQGDIDELTQEVIYRAIENLCKLRNRESYDGWIFGICRNVLYQYYRRKSRHFLDIDIACEDQSFERIDIRQLLTRLPGRSQLMYQFFYVERYKIAEISKTLGIAEGTVKYHLYDLRRRFRAEIEETEKGIDAI